MVNVVATLVLLATTLLFVVIHAARNRSGGAPRRAVVRTDICVGCGTCVKACPEPGVIEIVRKVAHVNADLCKGHGECAKACPSGGISLAPGGRPPFVGDAKGAVECTHGLANQDGTTTTLPKRKAIRDASTTETGMKSIPRSP